MGSLECWRIWYAAWADVVEDFIAFQISRCGIVVMEVLEKLIVCNRSRYWCAWIHYHCAWSRDGLEIGRALGCCLCPILWLSTLWFPGSSCCFRADTLKLLSRLSAIEGIEIVTMARLEVEIIAIECRVLKWVRKRVANHARSLANACWAERDLLKLPLKKVGPLDVYSRVKCLLCDPRPRQRQITFSFLFRPR